MAESGIYPEATLSVESLRVLALLGGLMGERGKTRAAETLGVSPRTLTRFEESRRLTPTLAGALERHLLEGGRVGGGHPAAPAGDAGGRAEGVAAGIAGRAGCPAQGGKKAREEQARALAELARRAAALEAPGGIRSGAASAGNPATAGSSVVHRPRRVYDDVVTEDAEPSEELVYGGAATAVIVRWREARDAFGQATDALEILNARQRRVERRSS